MSEKGKVSQGIIAHLTLTYLHKVDQQYKYLLLAASPTTHTNRDRSIGLLSLSICLLRCSRKIKDSYIYLYTLHLRTLSSEVVLGDSRVVLVDYTIRYAAG